MSELTPSLPVPRHYEVVPLTEAKTDEDFVDTWLKLHSTSPHTRRAYARTAARFIAALGVPLRVARLEDVGRGFEAMAQRADGTPAARATVMAQMAMAKSLLSFGARVRYLEANLGELFKLKAVPADRARRILSEPDTFVLLRSAESDRDALLLEVAYYGGLRVSELVCLTWSHLLDRDDGKMQIAGLVGKGGKEREVLLPADLANRLREFRQGAEESEAVFKGRPSTQRELKDRPEGAMSARAVAQVIRRTAAARSPAARNSGAGLAPLAAARPRLTCTRQQGADLAGTADARPRLAENDIDLCARKTWRFIGALFEEGAVRNVRLHAMVTVVRVWP